MRDSRSACSSMTSSRRSSSVAPKLVRVCPDARQRRLQVVADPAQEVVLRRVELEELGVLRLDPLVELGVADRDGDLAGEQFEQVLIGASPGPEWRHATQEQPDRLVAGPQDRAERAHLAGHHLLDGKVVRVAQEQAGLRQVEDPFCLGRPACHQESGAIADRDVRNRRVDLRHFTIAAVEVRGQAVVALGEARQLVVARDLDGRRQVAGRHAIDGRRDRPQWAGEIGGHEVGEEDRDEDRHDQGEQEEPPDGRIEGIREVRNEPEHGQRHDRRSDEGGGQAGAKREAAALGWFRRRGHPSAPFSPFDRRSR